MWLGLVQFVGICLRGSERGPSSASQGALHGAELEPGLETECSLRSWRCHGAVPCCAPAKPWQLFWSLRRQHWFGSKFRGKGDHVETAASQSGQGQEHPGKATIPGSGVPQGGLSTTSCLQAGALHHLHPAPAARRGWSCWGTGEVLAPTVGSCLLACSTAEEFFNPPQFLFALNGIMLHRREGGGQRSSSWRRLQQPCKRELVP